MRNIICESDGNILNKKCSRLYVIPYLSSRWQFSSKWARASTVSVFSASPADRFAKLNRTCERKFSGGMRDGRQSVAE